MAKKRDTGRKESKLQEAKALSRRDFFKSGAAAGVGAAVLSGPGEALAQGIVWNYEADVVVLGSGCVGLHAAVRARDLGASVIVIDQNFDVGGKLVHSGGWTSLGGGDTIQERDRMGTDPERLGLAAPLVKPADLEDDPDRLFRDMTDWSVVDATGVARYRYNDRELHRAWADNAPKVRQFMIDNYVRFARIDGTHQGGGMSRGRAARAVLKMADKTDIKTGTLSPEDRGDPEKERHSRFNPMRQTPGIPAASVGAPGWVYGGFCLARCLEFSAREYTPASDFEVVVEVGGAQSDVVLVPHRRGGDGYFMLQLTPPSVADADRELVPDGEPLRLLLVADTSASMDRAQRARQEALLMAVLSALGPKDTFNLACCDVACTTPSAPTSPTRVAAPAPGTRPSGSWRACTARRCA